MGVKGGSIMRSLSFLAMLCFSLPLFVHSRCERNPVIFMFGDSNSDTGGSVAGVGSKIGASVGRTFFHKPSGRLCDGRLVIDFLCESLNTSYLTPYLESLGSNFSNGANFAISGSSTLPKSVPFSLDIQIRQFLHFQARSLELISKGDGNMFNDEDFQNARYIIDIGQNDLAGAFTHSSYAQVIERIPSFIAEIKYAIWNVYQYGGRNFWIHNTGPLGCLPQQLATTSKNGSNFDEYGCLDSVNDDAKVFNEQLRILCEELTSEMKNATIIYVDMFAIKYDIVANSATYGFKNPLMACCGYGGRPYNYDPNVKCGQNGYTVCEEGSKYISWDGVHYTEAANSLVASKILSTNYSTPQIKF